MIEERSAGVVLISHPNEQREYLLLHYPAGHWDFPKGNIETGEKEAETVRRELQEETGISDMTVTPGFKKRIEYFYRRNHYLVHKEVTFYLASTCCREVRLSHEHSGYIWLLYEDALTRVTYDNAKMLLREAHNYVQEHRAAFYPMSHGKPSER